MGKTKLRCLQTPPWVTDDSETQSDYCKSHNSGYFVGLRRPCAWALVQGGASGGAGDVLRVDLGGGYHEGHLRAGFLNSALLTFRLDDSWLCVCGGGGAFNNILGLRPLDGKNSSPARHQDN